jgi:prepilin-type N-terminal cleavage/methylation domain-containing protein
VPHRSAVRHAGVTLMEMCIVVAVLGLAAAIALPKSDPIAPAAVDATASEIASALRFAQREAVRTNAWYVVSFDTAAESLRVYQLTRLGAVSEDTTMTVKHPVDKRDYKIMFASGGPAAAAITTAVFKYDKGATGSYATFSPDGMPADINGRQPTDIHPLKEDGAVTIRYGNVQRVVTVAAVTGRVSF